MLAGQHLLQHRLQQQATEQFAGVELLLQLIAEDQQFVDLGDDAVLFGEGWEGDGRITKNHLIDFGHGF